MSSASERIVSTSFCSAEIPSVKILDAINSAAVCGFVLVVHFAVKNTLTKNFRIFLQSNTFISGFALSVDSSGGISAHIGSIEILPFGHVIAFVIRDNVCQIIDSIIQFIQQALFFGWT